MNKTNIRQIAYGLLVGLLISGCATTSDNVAHPDKSNPQEAMNYLNKACDNGSPEGCASIAKMYLNGMGVEPNIQKAAHFIEKACDNGDAKLCLMIADKYERGDRVQQNATKAKELYQKACDLGESSGCLHLGKPTQKPEVTCENLPQLGLYSTTVDFQQQCRKFGVDLNVDHIWNKFLIYDKANEAKREKMIEECKKNCQDNKECIEQGSQVLIKSLQKFKEEQLLNKSGCETMVEFIDPKNTTK